MRTGSIPFYLQAHVVFGMDPGTRLQPLPVNPWFTFECEEVQQTVSIHRTRCPPTPPLTTEPSKALPGSQISVQFLNGPN